MAIGIEIFKDGSFFEQLPRSLDDLVRNQTRGLLYLLEVLSQDPFAPAAASGLPLGRTGPADPGVSPSEGEGSSGRVD